MTRTIAPRRFRLAGDAGLLVLALTGTLITVLMMFEANPRKILRDIVSVGWGLPAIIGFHVLLIACAALAWRAVLSECWTGPFRFLIWARWVREATNMLLPVAQIGGEVVGARLLTLRGMILSLAAASVILDKTNEALAQVLFTLVGLSVLVMLDGPSEAIYWITLALPFAALMGIGLLLAQRGGVYRLMERVLIAAGERLGVSDLHAIAGLDQTLRALFRSSRVANGTTIHLVAWITSAVEVWLALYFMGHRIDFVRAVVMESLGQLIRCLGFVVPGGLGVQEGGYLAIGAVLGVPPEAALAVSLVKRICQVVLGLPGLLSWQIAEARWLIHQRTKVDGPLVAPSGGSNVFVRGHRRHRSSSD